MQTQSLSNFIAGLEEPSGGVSSTTSTTLFAPGQLKGFPQLPQWAGLEFTNIEENSEGAIQMHTKIEVTGAPSADLTDLVIYRSACAYYLWSLSGESLRQAYESLSDIYDWHLSRRASPMGSSEPTIISHSPGVIEMERIPFSIE
jgi:hypothetical protein